jgi:Rrf2 family cysteine metabolism transcriptional repressor
MKISYKGDYALKTILDLAYFYNGRLVVPLVDIARRQNIPENYLEQIMLSLKGSGYVGSKRGVGGGFFLAKSPKEITIGDIVRVMEGPIEPIACGKKIHDAGCGEEAQCAFREVWMKVTDSISTIVDQLTFDDMMQRNDELKKQNQDYMYYI